MAEILKGAPVAAAITEDLKARSQALKAHGKVPCLAVLRVGDRPEDMAYERGALKRCEKIGIRTVGFLLPADCTQEELIKVIGQINDDNDIHGCLMFRPLPEQLDEKAACDALTPRKDVDSMTSASLCRVFTGRGDGFLPCTAQSCIELLDHYSVKIAGKRAVIIGRSLVIGRPVAMALLERDATVTICHSKTENLAKICSEADILIAAVGRVGTVDKTFVNPDQVVIDVGINATPDGGICGDVKFDEVSGLVRAITPVPAGVGSVTTAVLCKHVIEAAEKSAK